MSSLLLLTLVLDDSTTARISPTSLAPIRADGRHLGTKLVDFTVLLEPSQVTAAGFKNLDPLPQASTSSYNLITDSSFIDRVLAVNIETQRDWW